MVRSDLGMVSRKGGRRVVGGFFPFLCPSLPLLILQMVRRGQRCWWKWESWWYTERLGAVGGEQVGVPFGHELQTDPVRKG